MVQRLTHTALLSRYLEQYRKKPHSRVFAPLAEAYRKLGMMDEALKILKEGIKRNPSYPLGYLVLAQCYADQGYWDRVVQTLLPLTEHHRDNVAMQRLYAQACLETGDGERALETFKWLLFLNPRDATLATHVRNLEAGPQAVKPVLSRESVRKAPDTSKSFSSDEDDWSVMDFSPASPPPTEEDRWQMTTPADIEAPSVTGKAEDWQVMSRALDDDFFSDEEVTPENAEAPAPEETAPLVSHTLVDLYVSQNHLAAAVELLQKYIALNPRDEKSLQRLAELEVFRRQQEDGSVPAQELEGQEELMRLVEANVHSPDHRKVEHAWRLFLRHIQLTAEEKRAEHA
jgi:tetratricopeptide (TPR) repeat protein